MTQRVPFDFQLQYCLQGERLFCYVQASIVIQYYHEIRCEFDRLAYDINEPTVHLLYLLVSTRTVIDQFSGPTTLLYGPLKFKVDSVAKLFCDLSPTVLNFYSK